MMYTYGFFLFLILIAQVRCCPAVLIICKCCVLKISHLFAKIGAGIAAFALKGDLKSNIETNMQNGLQYYGNQSDFTNVWDAVQTEFSCCGVTNATNWFPVLGLNNVADSCCIGGQVQGCGHNVTKPDAIFQEGCFTKFSDLFTDNLNIVGGNTLH